MAERGRWVRLLLEALGEAEAVGVRATVQQHLGRPPSAAEITAASRAAYLLVEEGAAQAAHSRVSYQGLRPANHLVLIRPDAELDEDTIRLAAIGRLPLPSAIEAQRQVALRGAEAAAQLAGGAAQLARLIDVDLLSATETAEVAQALAAAIPELRRLQRQLARRAGLCHVHSGAGSPAKR